MLTLIHRSLEDEVNQLKYHVSSRVTREVQSNETSRPSTNREQITHRTSALDSNLSSVRTANLDECEDNIMLTGREQDSMVSERSEQDSRRLQHNETFAYQEFETEYKKSESALLTPKTTNSSATATPL